MTVVYLDQVFLQNALLDFLLLRTTGSISGQPVSLRRCILGAVLGGGYAVAAAAVPLLSTSLLEILCGTILGMIVFAGRRYLLRQLLLFWLLSCAYAGCVLAASLLWSGKISDGAGKQLLFFLLTTVTLGVVFRRSAQHGGACKDLLKVRLQNGERSLTLAALYDSGNCLTQPNGGSAMLVVDIRAVLPLWTGELQKILRTYEKKSAQDVYKELCGMGVEKNFSLQEYQTVGESGGWLLLGRLDEMTVGKKKEKAPWIALSATALSDGGGYCALWGGKEEFYEVAETSVAETGIAAARKAYVHRRQRYSAASFEQRGGSRSTAVLGDRR